MTLSPDGPVLPVPYGVRSYPSLSHYNVTSINDRGQRDCQLV